MKVINGTVVDVCTLSVVYVGYVYLLPIIAGSGVILNSLNLFVFYKDVFKSDRGAIVWTYLKGLTAVDLIICCLVAPVGPFMCFHNTDENLQLIWNIYKACIYMPLLFAFLGASIWITLTVSVHRCLYVSSVSNRKKQCPIGAHNQVIIILVVAVLFNIPQWFYLDINATPSIGDSPRSDFSNSVTYSVYSWMRLTLAKFLPIMGVLIANGILIKVTWLNSKKHTNLNPTSEMKRQAEARKMTAMLIGISAIFVICHVWEPFITIAVLLGKFKYTFDYPDLYDILVMLIYVSEAFSVAENFFFYFTLNKLFYKTMKDMFVRFKMICEESNKVDPIVP